MNSRKKRKLLILIAVFAFFLGLVFMSALFIYNSQNLDTDLLVSANSIQIYDVTGEDLSGFQNETDINKLPSHVKWAFICVEDKDFYEHNGVSLERIVKAAVKNTQSGKTMEGASTITQQLIKNTHLSSEKTLKRKIREAILAYKLEKEFTKDEILEMYLNVIYFGNGIYGIESAAHEYFGKSAAGLTVKESAALAGMIKSPARFDPKTKPDSFHDRANLVLALMQEQGKITASEQKKSRETVMVLSEQNFLCDIINPYRNAAVSEAAKILGKTAKEIAANGYKVFTFLDKEAQRTIFNTVSAAEYQILNASETAADVCVIASTPRGEVNAIYSNNPLVPFARRNFASALKPLCVYAPAIELGVVTPSTTIADEPYTAGDFQPKNFDGLFHGDVSVRESLIKSYNAAAVKILDYTGLERATEVARRLGLTLEGENMSLALGNTAAGTSFYELVGGYGTIANGGLRCEMSCIKRIENREGKVVWEHTLPYLRVLGEDTCFVITDMLRGVIAEGTAAKMASLNFEIAAKTGTCERESTNTDAINVSYTPETVLAVWHGNADMNPNNDLKSGTTGGGVTSFAARDIAKALNKGRSARFKIPPEVEKIGGVYHKKSNVLEQKTVRQFVNLNGKIGDTGAPVITFPADAETVYSLYRKIGDAVSLLEVIKQYKGEYVYVDRNMLSGKIAEYWLECENGDTKFLSNRVRLFASEDIERTAPPKHASKHWFF